jgi:hypothetical protein
MALAAMYQRIPYSILSEVNKKKPQNYSILKLPPAPQDKAFEEWERKNPAATTTFDDARSKTKRSGTQFKDHSFAKWEAYSFPKDIDFESALERIEKSNEREPRVLKYKLTFADGCHILLARSNWEDPSTLYCTEAYNPNGAFDHHTSAKKEEFSTTEGKKRQNFLADEKGHLKNRVRDETGNPQHFSLSTQPTETGKFGFDFTPVSYISHEVKPNHNFAGVRPGIRETNKTAHQFLKKSGQN